MTDIPTTLDEHTLATIDRWLAYRLWYGRVPGSQVAIGVGGKLIFSRAYGYADLEQRTPMRTDHLFRIASHSKTFTATRILQLVEDGRLGLDDRLGDHLREFAEDVIGEIVIRELLEHTSGLLRDGLDADFWQGVAAFPDRGELVSMVEARTKWSPGELFAYSNLGYGLLGAVIETVTGDSYANQIGRHIIEPLGLTNTAATLPPARAGAYACGYSGLGTEPRRRRIDVGDVQALGAAAGVSSTAEDLVAYFGAHALGDDRLLTDRSKRVMQRTANLIDPRKPDGPTYGLGFAGESIEDHRVVGHGGGFPGHITKTLLDPQDGLVITVLTNAIDGPASSLACGVLKIIDDAREHPVTEPGLGADALVNVGRWRNLWRVIDIGMIGRRLLAIDPTREEPVADVDELEVDGPGRLLIANGGGYGSVGESVIFTEAGDGRRSMRYGAMSFTQFDELPERDDPLT